MRELLEALLSSTLDYAPALIFGALGALCSERAGVVNVGVEGMMRVGAFVAALAALVLPTWLAVFVGMAGGALVGAVHAGLCLRFRADQVVSGMALNLVALAGVAFVLESTYGPNGTPPITPLHRLRFGFLEGVPFLRALSGHPSLTFLAPLLAFGLYWLFRRTPLGLRLVAVGDTPQAVATVGLSVTAYRAWAVIAGGALAGLGGAALSVATLDRFEHNMPAGLGFMAVAALVAGRWTALGALGASLFFAFGNALRIGLASSQPWLLDLVPGGVWLALPYALTLLLLAASGQRGGAPLSLGLPWDPEAR